MTDNSEDIGYLKAKAEMMENHVKTLFQKSDKQTEIMSDIHGMLKTHIVQSNTRHDDIEKDVNGVKEAVKRCEKVTEDYLGTKKMVIAFAGFCALAWSFIWKILERVFL